MSTNIVPSEKQEFILNLQDINWAPIKNYYEFD